MRIIKHGSIIQYRGFCTKCGAEFEVAKSETQEAMTDRPGETPKRCCQCPCCPYMVMLESLNARDNYHGPG